MDKKEAFKTFVSTHPELIEYVKNKEMTWQQFYEIYDIYGENYDTWEPYFRSKESAINKVKELTSLFKNVNLENVEHYINNAQKAIGIIQELTKKTPDVTPIIDSIDSTFYS